MNEEDLSLDVPRWIYPLAVLSQLCTAAAAGYVYVGTVVSLPGTLAGAIALLLWLATSYRQPRQRRILPIYLAVLLLLLAHGLEQWHFGFAPAVQQLFPESFPPPVAFDEKCQLTVFTLAAVTLNLLGAVGIFYHHPLGNYMAWFVMVYAMVEGIALLVMGAHGGHFQYVPGMFTGALAIPLGLCGASRLAAYGAEDRR